MVSRWSPGEAGEWSQRRQSGRHRCQITRERVIVLICSYANYSGWRSRNLLTKILSKNPREFIKLSYYTENAKKLKASFSNKKELF